VPAVLPPVGGRDLNAYRAQPNPGLSPHIAPATSPPVRPPSGMPAARMSVADRTGINRPRAALPQRKTIPYTPARGTPDAKIQNALPNAMLNGIYMDEGNKKGQVVCRHFAAMLIAADTSKSMAEIVKQFSTPEGIRAAVQNNGSLEALEQASKAIIAAPISQKELISNDNFGNYLAAKAKRLDQKSMQTGTEAKERIHLATNTHALVLEIQCKIEDDTQSPNHGKSYFAVSMFDPNLTNNHTRVLKCSPEELIGINFSDLLPKQITQDASNSDSVGVNTRYEDLWKHVVATGSDPSLNLNTPKMQFVSAEKKDLPELMESLDIISRSGFHEAVDAMTNLATLTSNPAEKKVLASQLMGAHKFGQVIHYSNYHMNDGNHVAFKKYGELVKANQNNLPKSEDAVSMLLGSPSLDTVSRAVVNGDIQGIKLFEEMVGSLKVSDESKKMLKASIQKAMINASTYQNPTAMHAVLELHQSLNMPPLNEVERKFFANQILEAVKTPEALENPELTKSLMGHFKKLDFPPSAFLNNVMRPSIECSEEMSESLFTTPLGASAAMGNSAYVEEHLQLLQAHVSGSAGKSLSQNMLSQLLGFQTNGSSAVQNAFLEGNLDIAQNIIFKLTPCGLSPQNVLNLLTPMLQEFSEIEHDQADPDEQVVIKTAIKMLEDEIKKQKSLL
jgi:hypothetical protein